MDSKECFSRKTSENSPLLKKSCNKDEVHAMKPPTLDIRRRMLMKCRDKLVAEPVPDDLGLTMDQLVTEERVGKSTQVPNYS